MPGPRFVDADQASKVKDSTLLNYRKAALALTMWMRETGFDPQTASEWDDVLVEYKHAHAGAINRAQCTTTIPAAEFVLPQTRKQLILSHAVVAGWSAMASMRHAVPMTWPAAQLVRVQMVGIGLPCLTVGILLQTASGLRPGEMLQLRPDDLALPEVSGVSLADRPLAIALGAMSGTKNRCQQAVLSYLDVVGAASVTVALRSAGLALPLARAVAHWPQYCNHRKFAPPWCWLR